jgi:glycosyltransferase involved in cell wall biosynthesis
MIEAMSAGTPVIAWRHGSAPEIIEDRASGFVVHSIDEAVSAVHRAAEVSRAGVRRCFEARFTSRRMAKDYVAAYSALLSGTPTPDIAASVAA